MGRHCGIRAADMPRSLGLHPHEIRVLLLPIFQKNQKSYGSKSIIQIYFNEPSQWKGTQPKTSIPSKGLAEIGLGKNLQKITNRNLNSSLK
jgi:hypothetical protein